MSELNFANIYINVLTAENRQHSNSHLLYLPMIFRYFECDKTACALATFSKTINKLVPIDAMVISYYCVKLNAQHLPWTSLEGWNEADGNKRQLSVHPSITQRFWSLFMTGCLIASLMVAGLSVFKPSWLHFNRRTLLPIRLSATLHDAPQDNRTQNKSGWNR